MTARGRQHGMALLAVLAMASLAAVFVIVEAMDAGQQRVARDRATNTALQQAKDALVAYAVSDPNRPGELPCPDVNNDGQLVLGEDFIGSNCVSLVGRLPWRTLQVEDLRDGAGERLWYALSDDFHANGTVPLNSDTAFRAGNTSLALSGEQVAGDLVAVVMAPGQALVRAGATALQSRDCSVAAVCNNPANYLDRIGAVDNADATDRAFVSGAQSDSFNDRVLPIRTDDIMWLVQKRAGREYAQRLREHYDSWANAPLITAASRKGFYPWAGSFNDPATPQVGVSGQEHGLLPMSSASVVWNSASAGLGSCSGVGTAVVDCSAFVVANTLLPITARVRNVSTAFVDPPSATSVTYSGIVLGSPTTTWTLVPGADALDVTFSATIIGLVVVRFTAPQASAWTTQWLTTNNWHQVAYYALAPDFSISGGSDCVASPPCLTIANTAAPFGDKEAIVVMAGRALAPPRPTTLPAQLADYFEGANQTPADRIFERNWTSAAFNDHPAAVRP